MDKKSKSTGDPRFEEAIGIVKDMLISWKMTSTKEAAKPKK